MKNISKNKQLGSAHLGIIVVAAVLLIGVVGYLFWSNFVKTAPAPTGSSNVRESADKVVLKPVQDNVGTSTDGWLTHTSDKIPFTFKYPSNWKVVDRYQSPKIVTFTVYKNYERSDQVVMINIAYHTKEGSGSAPDDCGDLPAESKCVIVSNQFITGYLFEDRGDLLWTGGRKDGDVISLEDGEGVVDRADFIGVAKSIQAR